MANKWKAYGTVGAIYTAGFTILGGISFGSWNGFHRYQEDLPFAQRHASAFHPLPLKLLERTHDTDHSVRLKFALPNSFDSLGTTICSVQISAPGTPASMNRWYTPLTRMDQRGEIEVLVRLYANGKMSQFLNNLRVGDLVEIRSCLQEYIYTPSKMKDVGMIAAGTGIAPMYQLLLNALNDPKDTTKFSLLYSNNTESRICLRKELDELARRHPDRLQLHYNLTSTNKVTKAFKGKFGFIDRVTIEATMPPPGPTTQILICGPNALLAHTSGRSLAFFRAFRGVYPLEYFQGWYTGALKDLGYPRNLVYKFGSTEELMVTVC